MSDSSRARARGGRAALAAAAGLGLALAVSGAAAPAAMARQFPDSGADGWSAPYIDEASDLGLMTGYTNDGLFHPYDSLTRAQLATILYRAATGATASDAYGACEGFSDCASGQWYSSGVAWCRDAGVVTGDTDASGDPTGTFRPNDAVTREEAATMLSRYVHSVLRVSEVVPAGSAHPDSGSVDAYAKDAMAWADGAGIITGDSGTGMLRPRDTTLRSEAAAMVVRLSARYASGASSSADAGGSAASSKPDSGSSAAGSKADSGSSASSKADSGSSASSKADSGSSSARRWVVDTPAWDETVVDQEAYDEKVVDVPEHTETVTVTDQEAYDETVTRYQCVFPYDGFTTFDYDEANDHLIELIKSGAPTCNFYEDPVDVVVHHDAVTHTEEKTVPATYRTVHHDAVTHVVHHDEVGHWE
ncbi:MAG: S-layer homology domain-containing protein [Coriobacteriales bacterium]|jgi:hypothetical protein